MYKNQLYTNNVYTNCTEQHVYNKMYIDSEIADTSWFKNNVADQNSTPNFKVTRRRKVVQKRRTMMLAEFVQGASF